MKEIANPFDNEDRIKRNNEWLYFHTPNHPHDKVKKATFRSQEWSNHCVSHQV
jgi:hypothetical protein